MQKYAVTCAALISLCLAGCGGAADTPEPTNEAEDFAARINAGSAKKAAQAPQAAQAPTIAPPRKNAAEGVYAPGTATDPDSATCGANRMGQFLGQQADDATRAAIMEVAFDISEIRFITPGSDYIRPDPTHPRLNIMIDPAGVIRDARCG